MGDVVLAGMFGLLGYLMMRFRFPRVTLVIALILGEIAERSFFQSLNMSSGDWTIFFTRVPSLILFVITIGCLAYSRRSRRCAGGRANGRRPRDGMAVSKRDLGAGLVVLAIGIVFLLWSHVYPPRMSAMPKLVGWVTIVLALIDIAAQFDTALGRVLRRIAGLELAGLSRRGDRQVEPGWRASRSRCCGSSAMSRRSICFGLLATTPVYIFLYMVLHGRKPLRDQRARPPSSPPPPSGSRSNTCSTTRSIRDCCSAAIEAAHA